MSDRKPVLKDCFKARKGLCVEGDSYLDGDLTVTGTLNFANTEFCPLSTCAIYSTSTEPLSVMSSSIFIESATFSDQTYMSGGLIVQDDVHFKSNLVVDGNVVFNANNTEGSNIIYLGDENTDNVVFNADVDSDIIPDKDLTYTLGASAKRWDTLHVGKVHWTGGDSDQAVQVYNLVSDMSGAWSDTSTAVYDSLVITGDITWSGGSSTLANDTRNTVNSLSGNWNKVAHVMTRSSLQITTPQGDTGNTVNWTPDVISNTHEGWWDASDQATIVTSTGNTVTAWNDLATSNYNLTGFNTPQTGISQQNGLNVIDIDNETDYFKYDNYPIPADGDVTFFIVCDANGVNNANDSILSFDAPDQDFQIQAANNTEFKGQILAGGIGPVNATQAASQATSGIYCATFNFTTGKYSLTINGTKIGADESYTTKLNPTGSLRIFQNRAGNQYPTGTVAEVLVIDSVADDIRQLTEGYLAHKWGLTHELPGDHPYKSDTPQTPVLGPVEEYFSMQSDSNTNDATWDDITYDHAMVLPYQTTLKRIVLRCSASQGAMVNLSMHTNRDETDPNTINYKFFPQAPIETQTQFFTTNNEPRVYTFTPQASANVGDTLGISISANRVINHSNATVVLEYDV